MTLHTPARCRPRRKHRATQPVLVGSQGGERAAMGVASYYHEGGTLLSSQGLIRSMHRSEGNLSSSLPKRVSYVVESTRPGLWPAFTTVEGGGHTG